MYPFHQNKLLCSFGTWGRMLLVHVVAQAVLSASIALFLWQISPCPNLGPGSYLTVYYPRHGSIIVSLLYQFLMRGVLFSYVQPMYYLVFKQNSVNPPWASE